MTAVARHPCHCMADWLAMGMPPETTGRNEVNEWCLDAIKKQTGFKSLQLKCLYIDHCGDWLVPSKGWEIPASLSGLLMSPPPVTKIFSLGLLRNGTNVIPGSACDTWESGIPFLFHQVNCEEPEAVWFYLGSMDFCKSCGLTMDFVALNCKRWCILLWAGSYEHILVHSKWNQVCYYLSA